MAYLVRRLLENASNEGFVHQRLAGRRPVDQLIGPPVTDGTALPERQSATPIPTTDPQRPGDYRHEAPAEWRQPEVRADFAAHVRRAAPSGLHVPGLIGHELVDTGDVIASVDPADPARVVARSASCGVDEVERAIERAKEAWPAWARTPASERARVLFEAAAWMRARRPELAALEVFEAGKPWPEADGDVCEAIDFCEYYGRRMLTMNRGVGVESPPGEANAVSYIARGVGAVIAPWNFPLAIPTGMVTAALVTGNAVVFKPAEQTPAIAWRLVEALRSAGLPDGVLAFLPGQGEIAGAHLVSHPDTAFVAFTGSMAVGLDIVEQAAVHRPGQRQVKRVIAEMGGKNAIVVDADADLDQAVPIVVSSSFGFAGQKCSACSRLIAVGRVHDQLVTRLALATRELRVGHPAAANVQLGPLIDNEAQARVQRYTELAVQEGTIALGPSDVPPRGYFASPVIVTDVAPGSRLLADEIFGPVLTVQRASTIDEAISLANDTDYALTAGIVSRSPRNIDRAKRELRAGNVYVNRPITGAVVGRQPFGGYGLSGVGTKAGGPDYLLQFVDSRAVSENTLRQGFVPEADLR
jgi:RHH-type proline utilization regulon transcriptional repressor/proline dehydrogenase/delta 1-pyrroline-5-carboxylate dehydrogenase